MLSEFERNADEADRCEAPSGNRSHLKRDLAGFLQQCRVPPRPYRKRRVTYCRLDLVSTTHDTIDAGWEREM